ncbi:MAG: hypothetical protein JNL18_13610 [Planctomycetaceae bacterium]|uniref:Uncharacterized protein n=1 Tax=Lacipirellula limnantheis TaxID=2528024 RepID=A0A517TZJ7_9BACT|nr:hypothetical protein [Lacipirellula limnantheis]MBL9163762.1 hypothetical protein [Planctomycetaceae bacterium]QDT73800.1 hypothetical protein I41_29910 [Lacipirellula limnantheis]
MASIDFPAMRGLAIVLSARCKPLDSKALTTGKLTRFRDDLNNEIS